MSYDQQAFIFHRGRHYVVYPDGSRTMLMPKEQATGYASMFGGVLHSVPRSDLETETDEAPSIWARVRAWLWGPDAETVLLFEPPPRKKREWMMHVTDAGDHGDTPLVELTCGRCGHCTGWVESRTVTEEKRGRPCPTCNVSS